MNEERRLMALGFPLEDAVTLCHSLRKEGTLEDFVRQQEKELRSFYKSIVQEVMG